MSYVLARDIGCSFQDSPWEYYDQGVNTLFRNPQTPICHWGEKWAIAPPMPLVMWANLFSHIKHTEVVGVMLKIMSTIECTLPTILPTFCHVVGHRELILTQMEFSLFTTWGKYF